MLICSSARATYHQQLCLEYDRAYRQQIQKCIEVGLDRELCEEYEAKLVSVQDKFMKASLKGNKNTDTRAVKILISECYMYAKLANFLTNLTFSKRAVLYCT